ncbi:MAG: hypothetical protein ABUL62_22270 [Myxococcales bacterium]
MNRSSHSMRWIALFQQLMRRIGLLVVVLVLPVGACTSGAGDLEQAKGEEPVAAVTQAICNAGGCPACQACINSFCEIQPGNGCSGGICDSGGKCCSGCLNGSDTCITGNTTAACGKGGVCQTCNTAGACQTNVCSNGTCTTPSVTNNTPCTNGKCFNGSCCTGCWNGTTCFAGTEASACGKGGGTCSNCNTGNECVIGSCASDGTCTSMPAPPGTSCSNGTGKCQAGACCTGCWDGTTCQLGTSNGVCGKGGIARAACTDTNPCTTDSCTTGVCTHPAAAPGTTCADGNPCNGAETCTGTVCTPGTLLSCDDQKPCTDDSCNPATGCEHKDNDSNTCSDGNDCSTGDHCAAGVCMPTSGPNCNDMNPCTSDGCDVATGKCQNEKLADTAKCDTGNKCLQGQTCTDGKCGGGTPLDCDDGKTCTTDSCDPAVGCMHSKCSATGDAGATSSDAGTGNEEAGAPGEAGTTGESGAAGKGGSAARAGAAGKGSSGDGTAGSDVGEGGASNLYVRNPGGCSCRIGAPGDPWSRAVALLGGAVVALVLVRRRARRISRRLSRLSH